MSVVDSNTFNIKISDGSSLLSTLASSLSDNQFGSFSMGANGALTSAMVSGDGSSIFAYAPRGVFDPVHKLLIFIGGIHGNGGPALLEERTIIYDLVNDSWSMVVGPTPTGQFSHGYYHLTIDPATGDLYYKPYGFNAHVMNRKTYGQAWDTIAAIPSALIDNLGNGVEWNPGLYSGGGGLQFGCADGFGTWQKSNNTWTVQRNVSNTLSQLHCFGVYSPRDDCCYMGGGDSFEDMWRITTSGTMTRLGNTPVHAGAQSGSGNAGTVIRRGKSTSKIALIQPSSRDIYEFNGPSGDTWSSVIGQLPFTAYEGQFVAFSIPLYECVAFLWLSALNTPATTLYLWKG